MKDKFISFLYAIDCYLLYLLSGVVASAAVVAFFSAKAASEYGSLGAPMDSNDFVDYISAFVTGKSSVVLLVSFAIIILVALIGFALCRKNIAAYTGMKYAKPMSIIGALVAGVALNFISYGIMPQTAQNEETFGIVLVLCVALAPFVEELVFRGILLKMFSKSCGIVFAAIITSVLFAISHGEPLQIIYTFVLGLILSLVRICSTSLWNAVALHLAFNITGAFAMLSNPVFSSKGYVLLAIAAAMSVIVACSDGRKKRKEKKENEAQ